MLSVLKNQYENPMILPGGDFNNRSVNESTREHSDMKSIATEATRGNAVLDIFASNFNSLLVDRGTVESIMSDLVGVYSDHRTVFTSFRIQRVPSYSTENYSFFHIP